ncbi:MAG TPA: hypothetical protein DEQ24_03750 [Enterococcus sp.]|nr:hypothetical protein [Enterococcus sp.]
MKYKKENELMTTISDKEKQLLVDLLDFSCHVKPLIICPNEEDLIFSSSMIYETLFHMFHFDQDYLKAFLQQMDDLTIYFFYERYALNFCVLKFPAENKFLFIGPYVTKEISPKDIQQLLVSQAQLRGTYINFKTFYQQLPIVTDIDITSLMNIIAKFCYDGADNYTVKRLNKYLLSDTLPTTTIEPQFEKVNVEAIKLIEERYTRENLFLQAICTGNKRTALEHLRSFKLKMDPAYEESLDEHRNRLVILNTLIRKAIEDTSINPFYIDQTSRHIAKEIANIRTIHQSDNLVLTIVRTYCDLVKQYSFTQYSPLIRDAINLINIHSYKKYTLSGLAHELNIHPSYLSQTFKRETGETIVIYMTRQKMKIAMKQLTESNYLIQEVAASIGIDDVNYFSKLFKKYTGQSPRDYRKKHQLFE